jgi:MFS superfamily sulfate permease-like transporter
VYAGGLFSEVGGEARRYLARLNADGTVDSSWTPTPPAPVLSLTLSGNTLVYIFPRCVLFVFLVVTMLFLMPLFHDLPEAVLGAIVIAAIAHLVDVRALRGLRRTDPTDFVLALLCFAGVLVFGLLIGLSVAVAVSLLALVYRAYRPSSAVLGRAPGAVDDERLRYRGIEDHPECETFPGLVILRVDGELFFANARWFRETVRDLVRDQTPPVREVLVHAGAVPHIDTTAAATLRELVEELWQQGVELTFARVTTGLMQDLERNGIVRLVGDDHFYDTVAAGVADFLGHSPELHRHRGTT